MISWMQRHKKWLVVTIWVSTIAFVGAGFVGWGSYNFGKSEGAVAKVGDREISVLELQNEYSNLYNQYARMFGDQFNQQVAKKLNLQDIAFNSTIQKALLLNYADEIGLGVTDEEIAKELLKIPSFQKDGKFVKDVYIQVLNQNRTNPADFEANLKRDLLVQKVRRLFSIDVDKKEIDAFSSLYGINDDINVEIIDSKSILVPNDEAKTKAYWEANKNNYMSNAAFELEVFDHPISTNNHTDEELKKYYEENKIDFRKIDGKIKSFDESKHEVAFAMDSKSAKKQALRQYLKLKKDELKFTKKVKVFENEFTYSFENIKNIKAAKSGEVLKPFENGKVYTIVKVVNKIDPKPLEYVNVRTKVIADYRAEQRKKMLLSQSEERLKHFKGTNIKNVSPQFDKKILSLSEDETSNFIRKLFSSSKKDGLVNLGDKVVLYKINSSIILPVKSVNEAQIKSLLANAKSNELFQNLMEKLESKYKIVSYMKKGE